MANPNSEIEFINNILAEVRGEREYRATVLWPQSRDEALTRNRVAFLLTSEARRLLRAIAVGMGMTQPAVLEILLREKAIEMGISFWPSPRPLKHTTVQ